LAGALFFGFFEGPGTAAAGAACGVNGRLAGFGGSATGVNTGMPFIGLAAPDLRRPQHSLQ
jgi:hypothetical protein